MDKTKIIFAIVIFFFISVSYSQSVTLETTTNTIAENESVTFTATLDAPTSQDVIINFDLSGTALEDLDFTTDFPGKEYGETVAGGNGNSSASNSLHWPHGIHLDQESNLYIADYQNNRVQKWTPGATEGITVVSGVSSAISVYVDAIGDIYVSEGHQVKKFVTGSSAGVVVAGGNGNGTASNQLTWAKGLFVDEVGNIYIADSDNNRIQKWAPGASEGITVAGGNGQGSNANQLNGPWSVNLDTEGNIYIGDTFNNRIQKWAPGATAGTTVAGGNGAGSAANQLAADSFGGLGAFVDEIGNIYVADTGNDRIQKWTPGANVGITVAGGNGDGNQANQLPNPTFVIIDANGNIYVSDTANSRIQKFQVSPQIVIPSGQTTGTFIITGIEDSLDELDETITVTPTTATNATLSDSTPINITLTDLTDSPAVSFELSAESITENATEDVILTATLSAISGIDIDIEFITEGTATVSAEYALSSNTISIVAGSTSGSLTISTNGLDDTLVEVIESIIFTVNTITNATVESDTITLNLISDDDPNVSISADETTIAEFGGVSTITATIDAPTSQDVIIDFELTGTAFNEIDYNTDFTTKGLLTFINNNDGSEAGELFGGGRLFVGDDDSIYISDVGNNRIQKWAPESTEGITVAGDNGQGMGASQFNSPLGVYLDSSDNIYISDLGNNRIQKWAPGAIEGITVAGGNGAGSEANRLNSPQEIFVDSDGNIYIADTENHRVQKWAPGASEGITVAGGNGAGSAANQLNRPTNILLDAFGSLFITDELNHRIQKWTSGATEGTTVAGGNGQGSEANQLNYPRGVYVDELGFIYIIDGNNYRIQVWTESSQNGITFFQNSWEQNLEDYDVYLDNARNIYILQGGRAEVVTKYQVAPQIIIPAGQTTGTLTITGIEDDLNEDHETVILTPNTTNAVLTSTSSLTITILDNNYAPVAIPDDIQVDEGATVTTLSNTDTSLLTNDTDAEGDALTAVLVSNPSKGSLTLNADGTFSYTHDGSETIEDSFTYKVNDGLLDSEVATVTITINPINNNEPTDIILSNSDIVENVNNQSIGVFSAVDIDSSSSYIFSLVVGTGDTDNSDFEIINDTEISNIIEFDYEAKNQYSIRIKALDADGFSFEKVFNINVTNLNDILIEGAIENTYCNDANATGSIDATVTQTNGTLTYLWTGPNQFSSTEEDVSNLPEGTYSVTVNDSDFSQSRDFIVETTPVFDGLKVCYVTSDAADASKNRIHLSYSNIYNASKYQILREGSNTGQYDLIGELDPTETSYLDDTSNNNSSSYNYKVRLLDNCGNLSSESSAHKTILLQSSIAVDNTVNLSWSQYEGVDYATYNVYRNIDGSGFEELVSLASTNQTFNDTNANVNEHSYVYYVSIIVNNCETTQAKNVKSKNEGSLAFNDVEIRSNQISLNLSGNNDDDDDGVLNINDKCPNSTPGTTVDANGCFFLPLNNFNIEVTSETCPNKNNGKLVITANETHNYIAFINNQSNTFTNNRLNISDLTPGTYTVCITVTGETFEQCYRIIIDEGITITGKSTSVKSSKVAVEIEKGTAPFNISINGIEAFETISPIFNVDVKNGDIIEIKTAIECEGVYSKKIRFSESIFAFPNPTRKTFEITLNQSLQDVQMEMFTPYAQLISAKTYSVINGKVLMDITDMPSGMYFVKVYLETPVLLKIIKK